MEQGRARSAASIQKAIQAQEKQDALLPARNETEQQRLEQRAQRKAQLASGGAPTATDYRAQMLAMRETAQTRMWRGGSGRLTAAKPPQAIEGYEELYKLIGHLPADFPVEGWEKRGYKQQLALMERSGLSREEQWTFLNAPAVISTLGKILDLQRGQRAYGLTQAEFGAVERGAGGVV